MIVALVPSHYPWPLQARSQLDPMPASLVYRSVFLISRGSFWSTLTVASIMKAIEKVRKDGQATGRRRGGEKKESLHLGTTKCETIRVQKR